MLDAVMRGLVALVLSLRYRIRVVGLEQLAPLDERGMVILPNHPALIDPVIMMTLLLKRFRVRALADRRQIDRPVLRTLARRLGIRAIVDPSEQGREARDQIGQMLQESVDGINRGEAFLMYPAGRIYRKREEDLGSNSAVEFIARSCPATRIVAVRTTGLWGSSFGRASGQAPALGAALKRGLLGLLKSGLLFAPRRQVLIEFRECPDFPRQATRHAQNHYLESFYNQQAPPNTYVPYSCWEGSSPRVLPEPAVHRAERDLADIPATTRAVVQAHLIELSGVQRLSPELRLAHDLGLDSLSRVELQAWLEAEFGFPQSDGDNLDTIGDVLLAACGYGAQGAGPELASAPGIWSSPQQKPASRLQLEPSRSVAEAFLQIARSRPEQAIVADQVSGVRSYRQLVMGILALKGRFEGFEGEYVGILLPASVGAALTYLTLLFAGKTPVLLNWTTGARGVTHCLDQLGIRQVVSARKLVERLKNEGFADAQEFLSRVVYLEEIGASLTRREKLLAALRTRLSWRSLQSERCPAVVGVLFTSGSENLPKAVPLTSRNLCTNVADVLSEVPLTTHDVMLGMLPPFHSFGLTVNLVMPLVSGMRVVFHSNPTEAGKLAAVTQAYGATIMAGTPTFIAGIVGAAKPGQLATVRYAVTGAERCPGRVYDALAKVCPSAVVLEGYGITECSPVVSVNRPGREQRETIGEPLPSIEFLIVTPEQLEPVPQGARGMLLVRGPSIFAGYLGSHAESPFVEVQGRTWYKTGDLVSVNAQGVLTFCGRMKRFIKLGGEMISLPAIEGVLEQAFPTMGDAGPCLAIEATPSETNPELVLFVTFDVERDAVNRAVRAAGLSPLHNLRRVVRLEVMPLLGSGKTDYRALKSLLTSGEGAP